ncbi:MAG: hypothetical protein J6A09_01850, partial [Alphaproteobacteria bacterium]|nr:hypothetical protein [Alphaproteobacteria bacterium]
LSAVNLASVEYNLPAFILEGILSDILSDTRAQARIEALNDVNLILEDKNKNKNEQEDEK